MHQRGLERPQRSLRGPAEAALAAEAALQPLLHVYGPWGASARVSYPYSRLVTDRLWQLPGPADLLDAGGNLREGLARQRDAPAGLGPTCSQPSSASRT